MLIMMAVIQKESENLNEYQYFLNKTGKYPLDMIITSREEVVRSFTLAKECQDGNTFVTHGQNWQLSREVFWLATTWNLGINLKLRSILNKNVTERGKPSLNSHSLSAKEQGSRTADGMRVLKPGGATGKPRLARMQSWNCDSKYIMISAPKLGKS